VAVTLEELEIFLGVNFDAQSAYQRVDQFATKTESRFKTVQATMNRAMGKDLLLTYKVNDDALTAANKHLESKRTHMKEVQQWMNSNPLTYKVDLSAVKSARADIAGLKADMRSLSSDLNQQGRITVEYSIDASKFIDKFEKAGDKVAQRIESRVASERSRSTSENGLFSRNMERILRDANKQGIVGRIGSVITAPARAIAGSVGDIFRGASFSIGEAAIKPVESRIAAQLAPITQFIATRAGNVVANASKFVQQRSGLTPDEAIRSFNAVGRKIDDIFDARKIYDSIKSGIGYLGELEYKTKGNRGSIPSVLGNSLKDKTVNNPFIQNVILNNDIQKTSDYIATLDRDLINLNRVFLTTLGIVPDLVREFTFFGAIQKTAAKRDSLSYQLDPNRPSVAFSGGFGDMGRHGDYHAAQYKAGNLGSNVISVRNSITDGPGDKGFVYTALSKILSAVGVENKGQIGLTAILEHLSKNALGGINDDEINLAANALYAENLTSKSEIIAYCGGNLIAKGAAEIIDKGFPESKVQAKGFAFGTPDVVRPSNPRYSSIISTADPAYAYSSLFGAKFTTANQGNEVKQGYHGITNYTTNPESSAFLGTSPTLTTQEMVRKTFSKGDKSPTQELAHFQRAIAEGQDHLESATKFLESVAKTYQAIETKIASGKSINDLESVIHSIYQNVRMGLDQLSEGLITADKASEIFRKNVFTIHSDLGSVSQNFGETPYAKPALDLSVPFEPTKTEKVLELATNTVDKVNQGLSALAPVGEAATNVLNDVAQGLLNVAGGQVQKRVDQLRGSDSALAVQGDTSRPGTMIEFGKIAAQDIQTVKQGAAQLTEQFVKFADGTIKAGKAARDFLQGLRSQGRTIQDLGEAVVEVSAELVSEFEGLGGTGAADIKLLTGAMAALKGEIDSLPPLLPSAEINESEKKTQELVQTAYTLYEVWDKLSKESQTISLAQGGVFDVNALEKSLDIIEEIEVALKKARYVTDFTYDQGMGPLIAQVRSVQEPLGRLKGGAYRGLKQNLSQVKEAAEAGDDTAQGFISGIKGKLDSIQDVANDAGKKLILEIKSVLGIASPSKVAIQIGKDFVAGFEIGLEGLDTVWQQTFAVLRDRPDLDFSNIDQIAASVKSQVQAGNQNIRVDQFGTLLEDEKPKVQKTSREIGFEIGSKTREGIDKSSPIVKDAITALSDGIINQLRIVAPGITGFIEGVGLDLNKLKSLGGAGLTLGAVAVGVGLFGGKILEVANNTADAATEQNRFKRVLDQTVAGGGAAYYSKLAAESNKYGVSLQASAKAAVALETSLINRPLAGQGVQILSGFQAQFASQGTPVADQERALVGVQQAIRKGKLQAEELYQIIEPLPGAMEALAAATGKTTAELFRATSQGEVFTEDVIQAFSDQLKIQSGLTGGADTAEASMGRLANQTGILSANVGQLSVVARKAGTDVLGAGLEGVNENAELFNITLLALTASMGIGLVSATVTAGRQLMGLAAVQKIVSASSATMSTGIGALTKSFLPLAAAIAAIEIVRFAWDFSQPTEEVKKLNDDVRKLLENTRELDKKTGGKSLEPKAPPPATTLKDLNKYRTEEEKDRRLAAGPFDSLFKAYNDQQKKNNSKAIDENIDGFNRLNVSAADFIKKTEATGDELKKIKDLQDKIAKLTGESAVATNAGDTAKVTDINKRLVELQQQLNKNPLAVDIEARKGALTQDLKSIDANIQSINSADVLSPDAIKQLSQLEAARASTQNLYNELQKINGLTLQPLQGINASSKEFVLATERNLQLKQRASKDIQAQTIKDFGGAGVENSSNLAVKSAKDKLADLQDIGSKLTRDLGNYSVKIEEARKKLKAPALGAFTEALSSLGTTIDKASNADLEEAVKRLAAGGRDPAGTIKTFVDEQLKARNLTIDQQKQNSVEIVQAEQDIRKSELDKHNAAIDYARQIKQSNDELRKTIEDNQRQLKRKLEDTIQETKQLFNDLGKIKLRNDLNSKIQTISGDFSDTVLSSLQSYFDKIAEVMDAKLAAAGIKTGLDRKLEDLKLGQIDYQRGVFNQKTGIADAEAAQVGAAKRFTVGSWQDASGEPGTDFTMYNAAGKYVGVPLALPNKAEVLRVDENRGGYGKSIEVRFEYLGQKFDALIAHFDKLNPALRAGMVVPPGTLLGTQGHSGHTIPAGPEGTHTSFDMYRAGSNVGAPDAVRIKYIQEALMPFLKSGGVSAGLAPKSSGTSKVVMTDTGAVGSNGLKLFKVDVIDANGNVTFSTGAYSGKAGVQTLETPSQGVPGSKKPIPEGRYGIGAYETGDFGKVGNQWIGLQNLSGGDRGAFGFHADIDGIPGSDGCIVFTDPATVKRLADAVVKSGAKDLFVNYGLGGISKQAQKQPQDSSSRIDQFIKQYAPTSQLKGADFVSASSKSGVSIDALVTQALIESHFGTAGRAAYTKNPLNYGNDDAGNDKYFDSFREGLIHAAKALKEDFFVTTPESFVDRGFKGRYGIYATDPQYKDKYLSALGTVRGAIGSPQGNPTAIAQSSLTPSGDAQNVAGAINQQFPLQSQLSAEKQRALQLEADKMFRDLKNQIEIKTSDILGRQIGLDSQTKQRRLDLLPQTPVIGALSQLNSKQSADAQELIKQSAESASLLRDIDNFTKIIDQAKSKGLDTSAMEGFRKQAALTKAAILENNKAIADTNPIKTFARDLRIATDAQLGQADSLAGQMDAVNALLNATGTAPTGGAARAVEAQFRAAREQLTQFNDATNATLVELERKAAEMDTTGNKPAADALRESAKAIKASADEFDYSGLALTDGAKAIAKANANLDDAFKRSLELRKPRDQFDAASQGLADKQAQLLEASGDSFGANSIKRNLQIERERKQLTDEIKANELEINKLQNKGTPESLDAADQIYATNAALEAQLALVEQLATVAFPSVASSLRLSIADAGSQAFGTLANAIADGNINIQTLSDIFKQAGQSIIQTVIEIGQQFIKNQIFNLLGGILGGGLPQLSGGGINAALPLIFNKGGHIPNYANGEGYTLPAISAALDRERIQSGGREPRLVVANTDERILNPKETILWETIAKYGFRNENYAMGGAVGGGSSVDGSSLSARNSSSNSFGDFIFNGGGSMSPEEAAQLRKDVAGFIDKRIQDTEIQRRRSGR
jgi:tape measure domain-containing protein